MRRIRFARQFTLLFCTLTFITSCNVKSGTNLRQDNTNESKRIHLKQPKIVKTQDTGAGDNVFCALQDKLGNLWFGTTGEGVYHYDGESFTNYTTKDGLNANDIWCVIEDKQGNILFGTGKGICRYDGKSFTNITQNTVLSHSSIYAMMEDKRGRLWVSDYKTGNYFLGDYESEIYIYDPAAELVDGEIITNFLSSDSVKNDDGLRLIRTNGILEDKAGNIWFAGQDSEDVSRYDGKSITQFKFPEKEGRYGFAFRSILEDKNGRLWFGTQHHGVYKYVPAEDRKGKKFLHAGKASFINFTEQTGASQSCIMSMIEDRNGNLWFCTDGEGAWRYDGTSFKNFNTKEGLLNNSVFSVVEDKEGNLWFGTRNVGLYRYDGKSFVSFSEQ